MSTKEKLLQAIEEVLKGGPTATVVHEPSKAVFAVGMHGGKPVVYVKDEGHLEGASSVLTAILGQ